MGIRNLTKLAVLGSVLTLSACATGPGLPKVDYPSGTDPHAKLSELQTRLINDEAKESNQVSPDRFDLAERFLAEAQDRLEGDQSPESVLEDAGYAAAQLQEVEENAQQQLQSKENLSASL